jgi:tripartite-type tricarboxylate transporter receptor subunit TctC
MMRIAQALSAMTVLACAATAVAQNYPSRLIRIVVPFTPGGPQDVNARLIGQKLTEAWGQSVVVENRAAAGGIVATEYVSKAAPDGYTLLMGNPTPLTIAPSLYDKLGYDPLRQFAPVILVTQTASVFVVHPSVPAKNIAQLVALAKGRPGQLIYGTSGIGSTGHLTIELFSTLTGIKMTHVPYKGASQAISDMIAGQIDLRMFPIPVTIPLLKDRRVRPLGVTSLTRFPLLPEVPTIAEQGLPGFESTNWNGILAPAGTPRDIIMKLHDEIARRVLAPEERDRLVRDGYEISGMGPEQYAAFLRAETAKWAKVIKTGNVKPE